MEMLKAALREIPKDIEILVIDAPAGRDAAMVMDEGQEVIIVTTPQVSSVSDALKMKLLAERMGAVTIGAIMNMVEGKARELSVQEIENTLDTNVIAIVPEDEVVKEALAYEEPFVLRHPYSEPTREIMKLAAQLIGRNYSPPPPSLLERIINFLRRR
jgi:septum site-determining protein MinD